MISTLLEFIVSVGVAVYGMRRFLVLRKYWQYRQEQVATESISVIARALSLGSSLPFLIKFVFVDRNLILIAKELIDVAITGSVLLIGSGLWVRSNRSLNPIKLVLGALNKERKEALHISNASSNPDVSTEADKILLALQHNFPDSFTKIATCLDGNITIPSLSQAFSPNGLPQLVELSRSYTAQLPPAQQAKQVHDVLLGVLSLEEQMDTVLVSRLHTSLSQLQSHIHSIGNDLNHHEVVVIPQSKVQIDYINNLPAITQEVRAGGAAYRLKGAFYSGVIADFASSHFVDQGVFSVVEQV